MEKKLSVYRRWIVLVAALIFFVPAISPAESSFGGLTFIGDRQGICVKIDGECAAETISFELATCDANQVEKEQYRKKMPFTLLVPVGTHKMTITKDGKNVLTDNIRITAEEVLEYTLP